MENSPSIKPIAYNYGIGFALFSILILVVTYVLNLNPDDTLSYVISGLNILVTITVFFIAIKNFKKENGGFLSLSQALKIGLAIAAVTGIIVAIYAYIHYSYVYPEFLEMMAEQERMKMIEGGQMTDTQIEQAMGMSSFVYTPFFMATMTLLSSLFFGFIISLIVGLIMKRKNPALEG